jgi:protein-S-isoprenylcysteine O-methyltransferase Ste14
MELSMFGEKTDAPKVIMFPPAIGGGTVVLALLLQWCWPLGFVQQIRSLPLDIASGLLFVVGLGLLVGAVGTMKKVGTNIRPSRPATALVASGVFKLTRNPMYVGGSLMMAALAFGFAIDWLALLFIPSQLLLYYGVIRPEERYLASKFGEKYQAYIAAVPRYLLFF